MESVESIAAKIAHEDLVYLDYSPPVYQQVDRMALERAIAAALTAERAKFAAFADEKGESMPVLGKLPVTADGCIAGQGDYSMWNTQGAEYRGVFICAQHPFGIDYDPACEFHEVFSTKQAAEAAKGVNP